MSILKTPRKGWTPGPRTIARTGFPTTPDPTWGPEKAARWAAVKAFADAAPSNSAGGWQVDRVAPPAGPRVAFPLLGASVVAGLVALTGPRVTLLLLGCSVVAGAIELAGLRVALLRLGCAIIARASLLIRWWIVLPLLGCVIVAGLVKLAGSVAAPSPGTLVTTVLAWAASGVWAARVNHVLVDVDSPDLSPAIVARALAGRPVGFTSPAWRVAASRPEFDDEPVEQAEPVRRLVVAGAQA